MGSKFTEDDDSEKILTVKVIFNNRAYVTEDIKASSTAWDLEYIAKRIQIYEEK